MKTLSEETKKRLRIAKANLKASLCTCGGPHDPFWMKCPRAEAGWHFDNIMAIVRQELIESKYA